MKDVARTLLLALAVCCGLLCSYALAVKGEPSSRWLWEQAGAL